MRPLPGAHVDRWRGRSVVVRCCADAFSDGESDSGANGNSYSIADACADGESDGLSDASADTPVLAW